LLDTYEAERRPIAEQVIWAASALHDIFMTHGKDIAQRKQTMFEPGFTEKVVNYCSGVAYSYRDFVDKPEGLSGLDGPAVQRSMDPPRLPVHWRQAHTSGPRARHGICHTRCGKIRKSRSW
jgi:hypothetical protein